MTRRQPQMRCSAFNICSIPLNYASETLKQVSQVHVREQLRYERLHRVLLHQPPSTYPSLPPSVVRPSVPASVRPSLPPSLPLQSLSHCDVGERLRVQRACRLLSKLPPTAPAPLPPALPRRTTQFSHALASEPARSKAEATAEGRRDRKERKGRVGSGRARGRRERSEKRVPLCSVIGTLQQCIHQSTFLSATEPTKQCIACVAVRSITSVAGQCGPHCGAPVWADGDS